MKLVSVRLGLLVACGLMGALSLGAQEWKLMDSLPGIDLSKLTPVQKKSALKLLRENDCTCGCGRKIAQCRVEDPNCSYSVGLAHEVIGALQQNRSEKDALSAAGQSRYGHARGQELLDPAVQISTKGDPSLGPADAPITLIEFSDFQCPYCTVAVPQLKAILAAYPKQVRLVFKQYPLEMHPQADLAAAAGLAAEKQGKFWPLHDAMYNSHDLSRKAILAIAGNLGLDMKQFEEDMDSTAIHQAVDRDVQDGNSAGVEGTPTLFVNGQKLNAAIHIAVLKPVVEAALQTSKQPQTTAKR